MQSFDTSDIKFLLSQEMVARFYDDTIAQQSQKNFIERFRHNQIPGDMPERELTSQEATMGIASLLKQAGLVSSTSEAMRMIKQGAVRIDGEKVTDSSLQLATGASHIYQVGKRRFAKIRLG